jgi:hypothetical protein
MLSEFAPLIRISVGLTLSVIVAGCMSVRAYDGPRREARELAHVVGSMHVTAGEPVSIILRRIDDVDLGLGDRGADALPGTHSLLIDCTVTESKHTSRHHLDVDADAGVKYRLVADTGPNNRECVEVRMVSTN